MLVPIPSFDDILKFNKELLTICEEDGRKVHLMLQGMKDKKPMDAVNLFLTDYMNI